MQRAYSITYHLLLFCDIFSFVDFLMDSKANYNIFQYNLTIIIYQFFFKCTIMKFDFCYFLLRDLLNLTKAKSVSHPIRIELAHKGLLAWPTLH